MTISELKKSLKIAKNHVKDYEDNKVALTKKQVNDLYSEINKIENLIKTTCHHDHCIMTTQTEVDRGYGLDRYYYYHAVKCTDCNKTFQGKSSDLYIAPRIYKTMKPIKALTIVKKYRNYLTDKTIKELGIEEYKKTKVTYDYSYAR